MTSNRGNLTSLLSIICNSDVNSPILDVKSQNFDAIRLQTLAILKSDVKILKYDAKKFQLDVEMLKFDVKPAIMITINDMKSVIDNFYVNCKFT